MGNLKLRRGTNAERLTITPLDGEPVYTTDTKQLFMGDGVTVGGNPITSSGSPVYTEVLGNVTSSLITSATHGLTTIRGVTILRPTNRDTFGVYEELRANCYVYLESNISLLNHILIIY
jgi:hypothetical protein